MAISGYVGAVYKTSGPATAFVNQSMTNSGNNLRYFITNATMRYWDKTAPITVQRSTDAGTTWVTVTTGFVIEYAGGHVVFAINQGTAIFRVSGSYLTPSQVAGGYNWSLDIEPELLECTEYDAGGYRKFVPGIKGWSGSFEMYWNNGDNLAEIGKDAILVLYVDSGTGKNRYEGYGTITSESIETAADGLVQETLDFQGTGKIFYREG
ncbi:hypothetical protein [Paenibacillus abyssi]|uniref:Uncharacterized protein n=1 Tax=Paenibacillus abyssi TaxID=1340531 RepID=A0A917CGX5_9BACL|nr:hypothetical protein [Paenibacillus abyssi]GGF88491.1 hypothetical protein GCM10010916_02310 [Paenibacillus abyssi]